MKRILIIAPLLLFLSTVIRAGDAPAALPGMEFLAKVMLDYLDTNGDGIVDQGEYTTGTEKGFAELDTDKDGFITKPEMDALAGELAEAEGGNAFLGQASAILLCSLLMTMDENKDGQISKAEFTKGCEAMFVKLDANHDGQLSKEELMAMPARLLGK
jgi:Ca2+-binding EF-hand superfamily protein